MGRRKDKDRRREREKEAKARQRLGRLNQTRLAIDTRERYFLFDGRELLGPDVDSAKFASLSEPTKTRTLLERVQELFDPAQVDGRMVLRRPPTAATVRTITEELVHYWPKGFVPPQAEPLKSGLRVLYWGRQVPSTLANAVTRASLYCDRILVFNPFIDDFMYHPERSPLVRPEDWLDIVASHALYLALLKPWIDAGIVELVVNPAMTNPGLREEYAEQTQRQLKAMGDRFEELKEKHSYDNLAETIFHLPPTDASRILDLWSPSPEERKRMEEAIARLRETDPILCEYATPARRQLLKTGTGANAYTVSVLAKMTGSVVVTDSGPCASIMRAQVGPAERRQIISRAFSELPMSFLNAVPAEFAIRIRNEGRLTEFRRFLEDAAALSVDPAASRDDGVTACVDRVTEEYEKYKKEWATIQRQLLKEAFVKAPLYGSVAAMHVVLTGSLSLGGLLPVVVKQLDSLMSAVGKRRAVERKPLGIIFDLDHGKAGHGVGAGSM